MALCCFNVGWSDVIFPLLIALAVSCNPSCAMDWEVSSLVPDHSIITHKSHGHKWRTGWCNNKTWSFTSRCDFGWLNTPWCLDVSVFAAWKFPILSIAHCIVMIVPRCGTRLDDGRLLWQPPTPSWFRSNKHQKHWRICYFYSLKTWPYVGHVLWCKNKNENNCIAL